MDKPPINDLDNVTAYLGWAAEHGLAAQLQSRPRRPTPRSKSRALDSIGGTEPSLGPKKCPRDNQKG